MSQFVYNAATEAATEALGAALAAALPGRGVVALVGTLGAGKTRLVQALAVACGVPRESVVSPTFVLAHEYRGQRIIHHLDAYRLRDDDEFLALGPEEYFAADALTVIEWADHVAACLPGERLEIHIEETGATSRRFEVTACGTEYEAAIERLAAWQDRPTEGERSASAEG
jgi:tRNA threonylcarbamoyladenosine biosynthesis protein TsaE